MMLFRHPRDFFLIRGQFVGEFVSCPPLTLCCFRGKMCRNLKPANARQFVGQDDIFSRCVSLSAIPSSLSGNGSQVQSASHLVGHPRSMYSTTGNKDETDRKEPRSVS